MANQDRFRFDLRDEEPEFPVPDEELKKRVNRLSQRMNPLLNFDRLLANKCPPPGYSHQSRQYLGRYSRLGPGLVVLDNWKDSPRATPLLAGQPPAGTVMHPDLSFDARRVAFAFCDHTPADPNLRQFFLWEVGIDGQGLRQLTGKAADRLAGAEGRQTALIEDFDPCYLPDGGIAFVSTCTQTHIRCQYGWRYFANFLLHRADANGENIQPLSFAEAPEWEPSVLDDGRILYTRWDYTNPRPRAGVSVSGQMHPFRDGAEIEYRGALGPWTWTNRSAPARSPSGAQEPRRASPGARVPP